ncbi:hypothetical protein FRC09_017124 [Ceratobasidium sp. 395]|nr:hypothetical protein FRC09_017124 [Ceratobasidium sp. 395]
MTTAYQLYNTAKDGSEQVLRDSGSAKAKMYFALYDKLDELRPNLWEPYGQDGAQAEDNGKVNNALLHLLNCQPSLVSQPTANRRLAHPACAYFLLSIEKK